MEWDICAAVAIGKACGFNIKVYHEETVLAKNLEQLQSVTFNKEDLSDYGVIEQMPKLEGRQMVMVLAPKKINKK